MEENISEEKKKKRKKDIRQNRQAHKTNIENIIAEGRKT